MDPVKIAGVAEWLMPSNKKEVQSFVSFINFYRHFIPGFSHHACALFDLTMKDIRFIWGLPQEDSFMKLKELVTSAPVLVFPNDDLPFRLEADGSSIATGETSLMTHRSQNNYIVNFSLQCDDRSCAIQGTHSLTQKSVTLSSGIRMLVNIGKTESLSAHRVLSPTSIINMHPWIHCYVMFMDKE
jgi:hypothetical protein